ncbi:hypothetical protein F7725_001509 [Dissostichus mawsoni]|uniref:Uncharacterized protein n=1 Tax=Dissostichus mawsoni TaxID=36200 RepID=A0A7J5XZZ2_DISMA|nr:hypothetical protein F7725_001509 [Dissostichus mawsoni]
MRRDRMFMTKPPSRGYMVRDWMTVRMSSMGRGLCSISCCITTAKTSDVYTFFSPKHRLVAVAANISEGIMSTLSREDLRDLFPGPENLFRRKAVWHACHAELDEEPCLKDSEPMGSPTSTNESSLPQTSTPVKGCPPKYKTPEKVVKLSFPEYVLHTDSELEQVRKQFFELAKKGCQSDFQMSKDLRCRLIRNTMTSMIAILRAKGDKDSDRYPSKPEVTSMAKRIVQYYPMLQDRGSKKTLWVTVYAQLYKRLQNVRSPQKTSPGGRHSKKRRVGQGSDTEESSGSTIILDQSSDGSSIPGSGSKETANRSTNIDSPDTDSRASMAKHYRTLQAWYNKKKNPDYESVSQLLDLEYAARRAFIDSDATREDNKHEKILEAYPCFRDIRHDNSYSIDEMKERWQDFCQKVQFYGVWKKMLKPPLGMDKAEQAIRILRVLPSLFPSPSAPPKKLRDASEALLHVLEFSTSSSSSGEFIPIPRIYNKEWETHRLLNGSQHAALDVSDGLGVDGRQLVDQPAGQQGEEAVVVAVQQPGWQLAEVQQQSADLTLELQAAGVLQDRHQVQLQVLSHTADLRLGQSWWQVC